MRSTADQCEQRNVWRLKAYAKWAAPHDLRNFRLRKKKCTNFCVYFSRLFCSFQFIERYGQRRRRCRYRDGNAWPTSKLNAIAFTTSPLKQIIIIIIIWEDDRCFRIKRKAFRSNVLNVHPMGKRKRKDGRLSTLDVPFRQTHPPYPKANISWRQDNALCDSKSDSNKRRAICNGWNAHHTTTQSNWMSHSDHFILLRPYEYWPRAELAM